MNQTTRQQTIDRVTAYAKTFKTRVDWVKSDGRKTYQMAMFYRIIPQCTDHMTDQRTVKMSDEEVIEKSKPYTTIKEWKIKDRSNYNMACERKLLPICTANKERKANIYGGIYLVYAYEFPGKEAYIGLTCSPETRWKNHATHGPVFRRAKETGYFPARVILKDKIGSPYEAGKVEADVMADYISRGWTILNTAKAGGVGNVAAGLSVKKIMEAAKRFSTPREWELEDNSTYRAAGYRKIRAEATAHMQRVHHTWTKAEVLEEARRHPNKKSFREKATAAMGASKRLGIWEEAVAHMPESLPKHRRTLH